MPAKPLDQDRDLKEMVRCVQLFFGEHRQQQTEIAKTLGISQSRVSRLLKRALDEGLYSVEFSFPLLLKLAGSRTSDMWPSGMLDNKTATNVELHLFTRRCTPLIDRVRGPPI